MKFKPFILFKDSKLLSKQAKVIFGSDLVTCAGFGNYVNAANMLDYYTDNLREYKELEGAVGTSAIGKFIDIGCSVRVIIKFTNGKVISFNSSEWGDIVEVKEIKNLE